MFQNLRPSAQIYILHKEGVPYIEYGSVVNVTAPKAKYPTSPQFANPYPQMEMVVDIAVSINGQNMNLQGLPAGAEIADFGTNGNIVVSCSRDAMNSELSTMKQKSLDILGSVDYHKGVIEACDKMLNLINPEFAAKQQQDKEIADLKGQMAEMSRNMADLMTLNKQLMEQLGLGSDTSKTNK